MIECNADINFGQPALKGRRLTVFNIVTKVYYEDTVDIALKEYDISLQDAKDAVVYCMNLKCKGDKKMINFCDGCLLRTINDGWDFKILNYKEIGGTDRSKIIIGKETNDIFIGNFQELEDSEFGKVTWLMAEEVFLRINHRKEEDLGMDK